MFWLKCPAYFGRRTAAAQLIDAPASLASGQCLGPYRIECFLVAGGMGKVLARHRQAAVLDS
jgi:hypothetical protein